MEFQVGPALDALKAMGINLKDWLYKAAKSKTMWFSTLVTVFGILQMYWPMTQAFVPAAWYGPILTVIGVISAVLRHVTTVPLSEK